MTGHDLAEPNGVMVPRAYPVAALATSASGIDSRLTPSTARSFGQESVRSPGTSTNTKSSSPRRTTSVFTTSAGATPRAVAASARLRTGPCRICRCRMPAAASASSAGFPADARSLADAGFPADAGALADAGSLAGAGSLADPSGCVNGSPGRTEPEGDVQLGTGAAMSTRVRSGLGHRYRQHLARDQLGVLADRRGGRPARLAGRCRPAELDPVGDVQAGGLAGLLDQPDHLAGQPGAAQLRGDVQVERDRLAGGRLDRPALARGLGDQDVVRSDRHRCVVDRHRCAARPA